MKKIILTNKIFRNNSTCRYNQYRHGTKKDSWWDVISTKDMNPNKHSLGDMTCNKNISCDNNLKKHSSVNGTFKKFSWSVVSSDSWSVFNVWVFLYLQFVAGIFVNQVFQSDLANWENFVLSHIVDFFGPTCPTSYKNRRELTYLCVLLRWVQKLGLSLHDWKYSRKKPWGKSLRMKRKR
jgi:hypothetical protein